MKILQTSEPSISEVLSACGARSVKPLGTNRWQLSFVNEKTVSVLVVADEEWLTLEVQMPATRKCQVSLDQLGRCLEWNGTLPGGVRFALLPHDRCPRIQTEFPLEQGVCSVEILRLAGLGLTTAFHRFMDHVETGDPDRLGLAAKKTETVVNSCDCDLEEMCVSAGWKCTGRPSERLAVELETPGDTTYAIVERRGQGVAASVELTHSESLGQKSHHAEALMLLTTCGLVRMIRATAFKKADERMTLGYEVVMTPIPTAGQFSQGLAALSVACHLCGHQETEAMMEESLAERYLTVRGWSS